MDLQKFLAATFSHRESEVPITDDALAQTLFEEGERRVWVVRGLSAAELGRVNEAAEGNLDNVRAMVAAMAGEGDKATAIRKALGLSSEDVPRDVSRRIEMLSQGSVSPLLGAENRDVAVKLAENFACFSAPTHPFFAAMAGCVRRVRGTPTRFNVSTGFNDMHFFAHHRRIPTLGYGPGGENCHAVDERARVRDLLAGARIYAELMTTFAG